MRKPPLCKLSLMVTRMCRKWVFSSPVLDMSSCLHLHSPVRCSCSPFFFPHFASFPQASILDLVLGRWNLLSWAGFSSFQPLHASLRQHVCCMLIGLEAGDPCKSASAPLVFLPLICGLARLSCISPHRSSADANLLLTQQTASHRPSTQRFCR